MLDVSLSTYRLRSWEFFGATDKVWVSDELIDILGYVYKVSFELVASPLQGVLDGVREVLQCAHRNWRLRWVLTGWIALRQVWEDDLYISLCTKCTRLQQSLWIVNAPSVNIFP